MGTLSMCFGQKTEEKKTDPDSSGVVDSYLLPTTMPLLLFDDSEEKEEKKGQKEKKSGKTSISGSKLDEAFSEGI